MFKLPSGRHLAPRLTILFLLLATLPARAEVDTDHEELIYKVKNTQERLTMTINSSRILELTRKIPRAQVNNPEILDMKAVSDRQIQIHGKKTGVTEVNLWDENGRIYSINVAVLGDAKQLGMLLKTAFPNSAIRLIPTANSVILTGYIDRAEWVPRIEQIAEDYYPKVINHMTVGGTQQVLLHVKLMEVSRTRLSELGFDFANISGDDFAISSISGLLSSATATSVTTTGAETFAFGMVDSGNSFFGVLSALQQKGLVKILAEPTLTTVSGRPAYFQVGGEIPVLIPQSLGTVSVDFRRFGTQVNFVPIVLGNGNVRLEVRPRVSELDETIGVTLAGSTIPGFRTREVETGVELQVGQTLCLAGLIQKKERSDVRGFPVLGDLPYVGAAFRRTHTEWEEVELLVMVRPELAAALDCDEVPPCGPGMFSRSPTNCEMMAKGYIEVPVPCPGGAGGCNGGGCNGGSCNNGHHGGGMNHMNQVPTEATERQIEVPRSEATEARASMPTPPMPAPTTIQTARRAEPTVRERSGSSHRANSGRGDSNRYNQSKPQSKRARVGANSPSGQPGLIGPTGYDVLN